MRKATRCRMHGGKNQRTKRGSRKAGGRPVESGLYAKYLRDKFLRDDYDAALTATAHVAHELAVARAFYARFVLVSQTDQSSEARAAAAEKLILLAEKITKLQERQLRIAKQQEPPEDIDLYEAWKASVT